MRLALLFALPLIATPALAATGQDLFEDRCGGCHTLAEASAPTGPTLRGVVGRKMAAVSDFQFSDALKAKGDYWTYQTLDAYLANPQKFAPGTTMTVSIYEADDRGAIIQYLATLK